MSKKYTLCFKSVLMISLAFISTACVSANRQEKKIITELEIYGIDTQSEKIKNPGLAGALNLLPGFGNFYLAAGTQESAEWPIGFINLLLWPASVIWGVPIAAIDANTINEKATANYYMFDKRGKAEMEQFRKDNE